MAGGAAPGAERDEVAEDLAAFGADRELIARWQDRSTQEPYPLFRGLAPAVELFCACATQWRYAEGMPLGLDYGGVTAAAGWLGLEVTAELFADLRVLESAALAAAPETRR